MVDNEGLSLIRRRRTVRTFTAEDVGNDKLEALLDAASVAPSSINRRPLHYVVIRDRSVKNRVAEALRVHPYIEQASVVIAVCGDPGVSPAWELDASAAIENMLLAATALGLGGAWVGFKRDTMWKRAVQVLREAVGIPEHMGVVSLVCIGYPAEEKSAYAPGERIDWQRVHYGHWDNLRP